MNNDIKHVLNPNKNIQYSSSWLGPGTSIFNNKVFNDLWSNDDKLNQCYFDEENYYIANLFSKSSELKFSYKINNHGFRSNHFKKIDKNKVSILTGGCSNSFGLELPDDLRWQSFLLKKIKKTNVELFDISSMGGSIRLITRNVFSFIRNYDKPDYIFLLFPDIARDFLYRKESNNFVSVYAHTDHIKNTNNFDNVYKKYSLNFDENNALMIALESIWSLEEFCKQANIKLFWSTWDQNLENYFYNNKNFNNYVPLFINTDLKNQKINLNNIKKWSDLPEYKNNINNLPYWKNADDGHHFGSQISSYVSDIFSEKITHD